MAPTQRRQRSQCQHKVALKLSKVQKRCLANPQAPISWMMEYSSCTLDLFLESGIDAKLTIFHSLLFQRTGWISWPNCCPLSIILPRRECLGICLQKLPQEIMWYFQCPETLPVSFNCQVVPPGLWDATNVCRPHRVWPQNNCAQELNLTYGVPWNLALVHFFIITSHYPPDRTTCKVPHGSSATSTHVFFLGCHSFLNAHITAPLYDLAGLSFSPTSLLMPPPPVWVHGRPQCCRSPYLSVECLDALQWARHWETLWCYKVTTGKG